MRLEQIMSRDIKTIGRGASPAEARATMRLSGVRHLLVLDGRRLIGVLSERDLGGRSAAFGRGLEAATVGDLMAEQVVTARPDTTVRQAANLLRGRAVGCLPVVQDERPVGIVTITDLLELVGRGAERPVTRPTRWTLRDRGPRKASPSVRRSRRG